MEATPSPPPELQLPRLWGSTARGGWMELGALPEEGFKALGFKIG